MRFAWHVHHNVLIEALTEPISRRMAYIRKHKPKSEQALRLKLLKAVRGNLPKECAKAWEAYAKAGEAYDKAWEAYAEARKTRAKAQEAYDKVGEAYAKAGEAYARARETYAKARGACENEINALHAKECPDCPWDGTTIFTASDVSIT